MVEVQLIIKCSKKEIIPLCLPQREILLREDQARKRRRIEEIRVPNYSSNPIMLVVTNKMLILLTMIKKKNNRIKMIQWRLNMKRITKSKVNKILMNHL
jgi:hypothetical protein